MLVVASSSNSPMTGRMEGQTLIWKSLRLRLREFRNNIATTRTAEQNENKDTVKVTSSNHAQEYEGLEVAPP